MRTVLCIASSMMFLTFWSGCGPKKPTYVPTQGTVKTKTGVPCEGALVVLHPKEKERVHGRKPFAIADPQGNFSLMTQSINDGAAVGDYSVTIVWPAKTTRANEESSLNLTTASEGSGSSVGEGPDQLHGKYGNPNAPIITVRIDKDSTAELKLEVEP